MNAVPQYDYEDDGRPFCPTSIGGGRVKPAAAPAEVLATPYIWRDPTTIPPRPWVFGRWFLRRVVSLVFAPGGVGKSRLLAGAALSLTTGRALIGKEAWDGPSRVWIWNLEDELEELDRDLTAAAIHHRVKPDDVGGRLFVDTAMEGSSLCTARIEEGVFRVIEPVMEAIVGELKRREIDVLVIDPFVSSHEVDENLNVMIDKIAKRWARVAREANCSVVLVHHTHKLQAGTKVTASAGRGASALKDAARIALVLNKMDGDEAKKLQVDAADRWRFFSVADDKHNRAPAESADWYRLASVSLDNGGPDGGDSVGVVTAWTPPDAFDGVTTNHLASVQRIVAEGGWRKDSRAERWVGHAVAQVMDIDLDDEAGAERVKSLLRTWTKNGALREEDGKDDATRKKHKFVVVGETAQV